MSKFDPTDPQYQVSDKFKPDKEPLWQHQPMELAGWVVSHNALRGELTGLRQALQAVKDRGAPLKAWEATALQTAASAHIEHIHAHHDNEDELFGPEFVKRFKFQDKVVSDHAVLMTKLETIGKQFDELKEGSSIDGLLSTWIDYDDSMRPHLLYEEEIGLPLMRAYFTPKEIEKIVKELIKRSPTHEMGSIIHFLGPDKVRNQFMPQEGIPFFVWYIDFQFKHKAFVKVFVKNAEAVKAGVEPVPPPSLWKRIFGM